MERSSSSSERDSCLGAVVKTVAVPEGAGVASEGVGGTEAMVLCRRDDCAAIREATVFVLGGGAC